MADTFCQVCEDSGDASVHAHRFWEVHSGRPASEPMFRPCADCPRCACGVELAMHEGAGETWSWDDVLRHLDVGARTLFIAPPCLDNASLGVGRAQLTVRFAWWLAFLRVVGCRRVYRVGETDWRYNDNVR